MIYEAARMMLLIMGETIIRRDPGAHVARKFILSPIGLGQTSSEFHTSNLDLGPGHRGIYGYVYPSAV